MLAKVIVSISLLFVVGCSSLVLTNDISLWEKLDLYGISTAEQKQSFERLLSRAGIATSDLLHKKYSHADLPRAFLHFVKTTQEKFVDRSSVKERWQIDRPAWLEQDQEGILNDVHGIGFLTEEKQPSLKTSEVLCVFGATKPIMQARIKFAESLIQSKIIQPKFLVLLTGERYVTTEKDIDGPLSELTVLAKQLGKGIDQLTEADLMRDIFAQSSLFNKIESTVIDTPRGNLPRPTTETTVTDFIKWLTKHPSIKSVIFVSNQPYVRYQFTVVREILRQHSHAFEFEVVGAAYKINNAKKAESLFRLIEALGSQMWAQTPWVLDNLHLKISNPDMRQEFIDLYKKQPLIFRHVEKLFEN